MDEIFGRRVISRRADGDNYGYRPLVILVMSQTAYLIFWNIFITLSAFTVSMLGYALNRVDRFQPKRFIRQNRNRLGVGFALLILLSILMEISADFDALLTAIGVNTNASPVVLGLAIGGVVVSGFRTQKRLDCK